MFKKSVSLFLSIVFMFGAYMPVFGYQFPQPDWGALLNERKRMVTTAELELYAEASVETAPYYEAKFEPRGGTYIGMVAENAEQVLPLGSYLTSIEDMYQTDLDYPANNMIKNDNVVAMIGWTIHDITKIDYDQVRKTLDQLNTYQKPMLIRFANEMNCSALGNEPAQYIEVFRNVANMVHEYPNFAMVWSPNDMGALDRPFEYFYPGDEYVDWVGISNYMTRYFVGNQNTTYKDSVYFMTGDYAFATNKVKPFFDFLKRNNIQKPVMISEGGVSTNNKYGDALQEWVTPRLRNMLWYLVMKYPQIKMINYFNVHRENETERYDISNYGYAMDIFKEAKNSGAYIKEYGTNSEFVFQGANGAGTLVAKGGIVPLYTYSYESGQPNNAVSYYIDGNWYHTSNQIPYLCNLNLSGFTDGQHILKIATATQSKEYTFYKNGKCIRFGAEPDPSVGAGQVDVKINDVYVPFDQQPIIENGRTLVPLRAIFEALGASVAWDDITQTVAASGNGVAVQLTIGSNILYVNDSQVKLDVTAKVVNGRTLVPVRAVSEAFDCHVDWDETSQTVLITQ